MNPSYYVLENGEPRVAISVLEWAKFFENFELRKVANTEIASVELPNKVSVSTVFLGIDHNFSNEGPPLLFETMIFGLEEEFCYRTATLTEAQELHSALVKALENA